MTQRPKFYKYGSLDKYDSHIPPKQQFIHDDFYVSSEKYKFHMSTATGYYPLSSDRWHMGVQKKQLMASGKGIKVDKYFIGKSDE